MAPPGAGKTTVVPLRLLDEPWLGGGRIVVLEPRRLATRAAARRMASLVGEGVGDTVGFRTRDERRVGPATRIEVVTEGILTRRLQHDPALPGTALVVFDEFHERNINADLALALALDARAALRPDLRTAVNQGQFANRLGLLEEMEQGFYGTYQSDAANAHRRMMHAPMNTGFRSAIRRKNGRRSSTRNPGSSSRCGRWKNSSCPATPIHDT